MATFTINEYLGYSKKLQKELETVYPININKSMSKSLQIGVRRMAPQGSTSSLKRVELKVVNNSKINLIGPNHWSYVDAGVYPKKNGEPMFLPLEVARAHAAHPGSTAGKKVDIKGTVDGWFQVDSSGRGKGFVTNSIKKLKQRAPKVIEREFLKLAKK